MRRLVYLCVLCMTALMVGCTEDEVPIFGDVYGTIYNSETGEPVRNAEIILSPNNMSTVSGSDGHFEFRQLEAKQYTISVAADGYESNSRQVAVVPGQSTSCDIHLTPKTITEVFNIDFITLNFGTTQTQLAVTVTNDSPNETRWSLDLGQNTWLKATPIAGQLGAGKKQTIVFSANRANLTQEVSGIITIAAQGNTSSLTVNCSPSKQVSSIMEVTPLDIDFGDLSTEQVFRIKNKSNALLNWTVFGIEEEAITVSDKSGVIQPGNAKVVSIKLDRSKLTSNQLVTSFTISDGTVDQQMNVNIGSHESNVAEGSGSDSGSGNDDNPDQPSEETPIGKLELPAKTLDFGLNYGRLPFSINNVGDATLNWSIVDVQDDIFSFSPDSGTLEAGNSTEIQVSIDRDNLPAGVAESAFAISDGVNKYVVTVKYEEPTYTDGKIKLSTDTVDFGSTKTLQFFGVDNEGTTYLSWTASDIPEYITFNYGYLTSKQGMGSTINNRVELNRETMPDKVDTYITITNDYNPEDTHKVRITATKEGSGSSEDGYDYTKGLIQVSPTTIDFGTTETKKAFSIKNIGPDWLEWDVTDLPEYISVIDDQDVLIAGGAIQAGLTREFYFTLNRETMPDNVDAYITIKNNYNSEDTHQVRITATKEGGSDSNNGDSSSTDIPNNQIWYTSTDGNVVTPYSASAFGVNIASNVYENGKGVITFDGDVAVIGYQAFHNCRNLASISLPNSVTSIVKQAFHWCSRLVSINIPNSVNSIGDEAFVACYDLKSITIPNNVNSIGSAAFSSCTSLESITLPNGITSIADMTFYDCEKLTSITIPSSVMSIGRYAFEECSNLTSINIPDNVTSIGYQAFSECSNLTSINIPSGVTSIEENTFIDCSKLASINLPDGIISIGEEAFYRCSSLTSINIPASVTSIDSYAFGGCNALSQVHITNLSAWCKITFEYGAANPLHNKHYNYLGQEVYADLFLNGTKVTDLVIPADITTIKSYTFYSCHTLKSITIHNNVSTIGSSAFSGCANVSTVTIGSGVTNIQYAFDATNSLSTIYCKAVTPPQLSESTFSNVATDCKIYVPTPSVDAYKAATNWSTYADKIAGYNFQ